MTVFEYEPETKGFEDFYYRLSKIHSTCSAWILLNIDWKLKCPSFQNAQRQNAHGNILPKDFMPNMTICPRRHFA